MARGDRAIRYSVMRFMVLLPLGLAACVQPQASDNAENTTDPAISEALAEPLMTDVQMQSAAGSEALRPGEQPSTLMVPVDAVVDTEGAPTLGQVAALRGRDAAFAGCDPAISYSALWSVKLPPALALPDGARLSEAAGSDRTGCSFRVVRFGIALPPVAALDLFAGIARKGGYVVRRSDTALSATKTADGSAFHVDAVTSKDGTRVDLVTRTR